MSHNHAAETNISAVQNVKNFTDFVVHFICSYCTTYWFTLYFFNLLSIITATWYQLNYSTSSTTL